MCWGGGSSGTFKSVVIVKYTGWGKEPFLLRVLFCALVPVRDIFPQGPRTELATVFVYQVKWMMYWIIFALFTTAETFTDIFLCWWAPDGRGSLAWDGKKMEMFTKGKRGHKGALPPEHGDSGFRCIEVFCLEEPCFLSQRHRRKSKKEDGTAQWYLISEKSLQESQSPACQREAQLIAELDAHRDHHVNNSSFSYRHSSRLT